LLKELGLGARRETVEHAEIDEACLLVDDELVGDGGSRAGAE